MINTKYIHKQTLCSKQINCQSPTITTTPTTTTTKTVVGLRESNGLKPPPTTTTPTNLPTGTPNYMIEEIKRNSLKTKIIIQYEETPKQFLNPIPTPKIAYKGPKSQKQPQN